MNENVTNEDEKVSFMFLIDNNSFLKIKNAWPYSPSVNE